MWMVNLRPPTQARTAASGAVSGAVNRSNTRLWILLGVVLLTLLLVVLILPSMVAEPVSTQQAAVAGSEQKPVAASPLEATETDQLRAGAEQSLQRFLRLQAQPDLRNVEVWAADQWQTAFNSAAVGDDYFGQGNFAAALKAYKDAGTRLQTILDSREQTLQQSLATGWRHLQENAVEDAVAAFERVIAMQPDDRQAQLGLERSAVRLQVLEFFINGQQAEISNLLQPAADAYTLALRLDPLYSPAREAIEKVESELRQRAFQNSMGRALQGIDTAEFGVAEKALQEAAGIRPGDPAIKDARQRLLSTHRQARLNSLRNQVELLESNEDWDAVADLYTRALAIESQAAFARNGLARAQERLQLHQQLNHYLADTRRLFSDDPLNNARELLAANQQIADKQPLLTQKLEKLQTAVTVAVIPVDLLILSDNLTQVTIYKVGRLGSFKQKYLSLKPGTYTVTGARQGYRDVLKVIELRPATKGQSLTINTGEQI